MGWHPTAAYDSEKFAWRLAGATGLRKKGEGAGVMVSGTIGREGFLRATAEDISAATVSAFLCS